MTARVPSFKITSPSEDSVTETRRAEWHNLLEELTNDPHFAMNATVESVEIAATEQAVVITATGRDVAVPMVCTTAKQVLTPHVTEYVDIIRKLANTDEGFGSVRFEALDMAKKLAHDAGARVLQTSCAELGMNHATARRLFSIVFALRVDTTALTGVRSHRPIR